MNTYNNKELIFIDDLKIESILSELQYMNVNEISNGESILETLDSMNENYESKNTGKFESARMELNNKFRIIKQNHENNFAVISKTLEKYRDVSSMVSEKFNNI